METLGLMSIVIIVLTVVVSYRAFSDHSLFDKYAFEVDKIRINKEYYRLITSGFLHINWQHLVFNLFSLYFFSDGLEGSVGQVNYLIIYFVSLAGGNLLSLLIHKNQGDYSAVGASGAVSGIIFASIALFPGMEIHFFILPIGIPAWLYGVVYVLYSIYGIKSRTDNVGHDAHLGGGLVGLFTAVIMYPSLAMYNVLPILLITVPAAVFIYFIVTRPGFLLIDSYFFKKHHFYSPDEKYNYQRSKKQHELDDLLDKINRRGYNSLSQREKERLKELSR